MSDLGMAQAAVNYLRLAEAIAAVRDTKQRLYGAGQEKNRADKDYKAAAAALVNLLHEYGYDGDGYIGIGSL